MSPVTPHPTDAVPVGTDTLDTGQVDTDQADATSPSDAQDTHSSAQPPPNPLFDRAVYPMQISAGRDIRAGHLRGCRLEFAALVQKSLIHDPIFMEAMRAARARGSLLSDNKLANLYLILRYATPHPDAPVFEFGSFKGGSAVFMATVLKRLERKAQVFAFDTFEGMPDTDPLRDLHRKGDFAQSEFEGLQSYVEEHALGEHLRLVKGLFDATLPGVLAEGHRPGLLHIDCDIYQPILYVIRACAPRMPLGSYVVFDDPLHGSCLGAFDAVQELMVREMDLTAEQAYPHLVYRYPALAGPDDRSGARAWLRRWLLKGLARVG